MWNVKERSGTRAQAQLKSGSQYKSVARAAAPHLHFWGCQTCRWHVADSPFPQHHMEAWRLWRPVATFSLPRLGYPYYPFFRLPLLLGVSSSFVGKVLICSHTDLYPWVALVIFVGFLRPINQQFQVHKYTNSSQTSNLITRAAERVAVLHEAVLLSACTCWMNRWCRPCSAGWIIQQSRQER